MRASRRADPHSRGVALSPLEIPNLRNAPHQSSTRLDRMAGHTSGTRGLGKNRLRGFRLDAAGFRHITPSRTGDRRSCSIANLPTVLATDRGGIAGNDVRLRHERTSLYFPCSGPDLPRASRQGDLATLRPGTRPLGASFPAYGGAGRNNHRDGLSRTPHRGARQPLHQPFRRHFLQFGPVHRSGWGAGVLPAYSQGWTFSRGTRGQRP